MNAHSTSETGDGTPLISRTESIVAPLACAAIAALFAVMLYLRVAS